MTCVVAFTDGNKVYLAADSSAVDENIVLPRKTSKVFVNGEFGMGYCHSFRLGQIVEHFFSPPAIVEDDLLSYMIVKFVPALRKALDKQEFPSNDSEKSDWALLIGIRGRIFVIESDWQVGEDTMSYHAIGAGMEYALGALHATKERDPRKRLTAALQAAKEYSPYVREPFNFIEV